jgi:GT2 family glycosyltransferase
MRVSVIIATHDRRDDLFKTCTRLDHMRPAADEVLICADACTDDTSRMVRTEFPGFTLLENDRSLGSVGSRDRLLRAATGDIVVSLDDDSYPMASDFFARIVRVFEMHPDAAVVSLPELRDGGTFSDHRKTDLSPGHCVSAYANCAAAMRRDVYLRLQGFPRFFVHMYEEPDYALQCYAAGCTAWFEPSLPVRHRCSVRNRSEIRRHHQNARNELWSVWLRCPWPWLPLVSAFRVWRQLRYAMTNGWSWVSREPLWWASALLGVARCAGAREAVPWRTYYRWMRLARARAGEPALTPSSHAQAAT